MAGQSRYVGRHLHVVIAAVTLLRSSRVFADIVDTELGLNVSFDPLEVDQLEQEHIAIVTLNYSLHSAEDVLFRIRSADTNIAVVDGLREITLHTGNVNASRTNDSFQVKGIFLGRTKLYFSAWINSSSGVDKLNGSVSEGWRDLAPAYNVTVIREDGPLNTAFLVSVIVLVVLANAAMGCKVELSVVKEILKKPLAPIIGLLSQFIIMPLLGLAASFAFQFDPGTALGLFATGCAPGGGASNAYTFLLDGDVSLSITMTLVSTLASFGLIPLWLFTIGTRVLYKDAGVRIPYENIFTSLAGLILPVLFGMLIQWKRPHWVKYILKAVTPLMIITVIVILGVGIYANLYIFKLLRPEVLAAGAILPNCGFILGGLAALATRQPWHRVKTIAVETGLQNTGIPIVLLQVSLPKPDSDFAIVAPIASAIFTPILLWVWIVARFIRKKCCHKTDDARKTTGEDVDLTSKHETDDNAQDSPAVSPPNSPERH